MKNDKITIVKTENPEVALDFATEKGLSLKPYRFQAISQDELFSRLENMVEDGYLIPSRDKKTWQLLTARARYQKKSVEEILAEARFSVKGVKRAQDRSKFFSDDDCRAAIKECTDEDGVVRNLSKRYPNIRVRIYKIAKREKVSFETALNMFMGTEDGTYKYDQHTSVFGFGKISIYGDDEELNQRVAEIIRGCMDDRGYVLNLKKNSRSVFTIISKLSNVYGITMEEALRIFVPEAYYKANTPRSYYDEARLIEMAKAFDDGTGCIDELRNNPAFVTAVRKLAKQNNISVNEQLEKLGSFYFSRWPYQVDIFDYVSVMLDYHFGQSKDATGLMGVNPQLYRRVRMLRYNFPGGALKTNEEMLNYFGYAYDGFNGQTKFTKEYVEAILKKKYGEGGEITNIYDDKVVGNAIFYYSGIIGKSFKETIEGFGYTYNESAGMNRFKCLNLTPEEYKLYMRHKEHMRRRNPLMEGAASPKAEKPAEVIDDFDLDPRTLFDDESDEPGGDE